MGAGAPGFACEFDVAFVAILYEYEIELRNLKEILLFSPATVICSLFKVPLSFLMLRSQIKLTSYDFSDLHITGEFDNRPGTGRFLRIFFCVVTFRTGAGRCLYIKTSAGVVRDQPDTVRCPVDFTRIFTCNDENMYIKIRYHTSKETVC